MEAHDCTVPHFSHSLCGATNVAKQDLAQKYLEMVFSLCFVLLEVQDRSLAKMLPTENFSTKFTISFVKVQTPPWTLLLLFFLASTSCGKQRQSKTVFTNSHFHPPFNSVTASRFKTRRCPCYSFALDFSASISFIACLWWKSAVHDEWHVRSTTDNSNKRDNPLFSMMSPCMAMIGRVGGIRGGGS